MSVLALWERNKRGFGTSSTNVYLHVHTMGRVLTSAEWEQTTAVLLPGPASKGKTETAAPINSATKKLPARRACICFPFTRARLHAACGVVGKWQGILKTHLRYSSLTAPPSCGLLSPMPSNLGDTEHGSAQRQPWDTSWCSPAWDAAREAVAAEKGAGGRSSWGVAGMAWRRCCLSLPFHYLMGSGRLFCGDLQVLSQPSEGEQGWMVPHCCHPCGQEGLQGAGWGDLGRAAREQTHGLMSTLPPCGPPSRVTFTQQA